jgi:hypothetical protein
MGYAHETAARRSFERESGPIMDHPADTVPGRARRVPQLLPGGRHGRLHNIHRHMVVLLSDRRGGPTPRIAPSAVGRVSVMCLWSHRTPAVAIAASGNSILRPPFFPDFSLLPALLEKPADFRQEDCENPAIKGFPNGKISQLLVCKYSKRRNLFSIWKPNGDRPDIDASAFRPLG